MSQQYKFSNIPFNQNELYQSLEKNGVLDITKAYLRSNLIETLKSKSTAFSNTQASLSQSLPSLNSNPLIKLGLSLVNDFLSKLKLEYTLSTFQSESKSLLNASIPFSEGEMLGLLNVNLKDFNEYKDEKSELTNALCEACNATLVRIIGNVAILYREAENPDDRQFEL